MKEKLFDKSNQIKGHKYKKKKKKNENLKKIKKDKKDKIRQYI